MTYVSVLRGRRAGKSIVHVDCPLEAFAVSSVSYMHRLFSSLRMGWMDGGREFDLRKLACHVPVSVPGSGTLSNVNKIFHGGLFVVGLTSAHSVSRLGWPRVLKSCLGSDW
jgi:hypothetical protein